MAFPGLLALLGSGETTALGGQVFEALIAQGSEKLRIGILETPAGFELNSAEVAGRVKKYLETRLQNYSAQVDLIPARKKGTRFSPDDAQIAGRILEQDLLFMGPGSPSYAVRQLQGSLIWQLLQARHSQGMPLVFASAAAIAMGRQALPVYEIYKVGEDPHWKPGLDLLGCLGLNLVVVPHWNNNDGGEELDTRRCFLGVERFGELAGQVDRGSTILGIDESTAAILDFVRDRVQVLGRGSIHIHRQGEEQTFAKGETFPLALLGEYTPAVPNLPERVWEMLRSKPSDAAEPVSIPEQVLELVTLRNTARAAANWTQADILRSEIQALGWSVVDTPEGAKVFPIPTQP